MSSAEDWDFSLRNELNLVFYATQAAWPHLVQRGGGSIINTAAIGALRGTASLGASAHAAAKGGVIALTRQFAGEGARHRIRANSISPGAVATPALKALPRGKLEELTASYPLGRIGQPEDIAYAALFLASDEASWITGIDLVIDGGLTTMW